MARIKGTNLVHTQSFIDSVFGLEGWASVGAELPRVGALGEGRRNQDDRRGGRRGNRHPHGHLLAVLDDRPPDREGAPELRRAVRVQLHVPD